MKCSVSEEWIKQKRIWKGITPRLQATTDYQWLKKWSIVNSESRIVKKDDRKSATVYIEDGGSVISVRRAQIFIDFVEALFDSFEAWSLIGVSVKFSGPKSKWCIIRVFKFYFEDQQKQWRNKQNYEITFRKVPRTKENDTKCNCRQLLPPTQRTPTPILQVVSRELIGILQQIQTSSKFVEYQVCENIGGIRRQWEHFHVVL